MFFKDFVSVKRKKIKKGASQTYDTPSSIKYSRESKTYYYTNDFDLKSKILKL